MGRKTLVCIAVAGLFLFSGTFTAAFAGFEPSPFMPEINRLDAIYLNLSALGKRVDDVLSCPPDDTVPSPDLNGAVNKLSAITNQLGNLNGLLGYVMADVIEALPSTAPEDLVPIRDALSGVRSGAEAIVQSIDTFLGIVDVVMQGTEPSPFHSALMTTRLGAQTLVDSANNYLAVLGFPTDPI